MFVARSASLGESSLQIKSVYMHSILYTNPNCGIPRNKFQKQSTSLTWQFQHSAMHTTVNVALDWNEGYCMGQQTFSLKA